MISFAGVDNCLYGALPASICFASSLESLVLDGMGTASSCRIRLFIESYELRKSVDGRLGESSAHHANISLEIDMKLVNYNIVSTFITILPELV